DNGDAVRVLARLLKEVLVLDLANRFFGKLLVLAKAEVDVFQVSLPQRHGYSSFTRAYPLSATVSGPQHPPLVQPAETLRSSAPASLESRSSVACRRSSSPDKAAGCASPLVADSCPRPCERTRCGGSIVAWQRPGGIPPGRSSPPLP